MSLPIEARVHAPTAPLWQRTTAYVVGWAFIASGLVALDSFPIADALLAMGASILFGASIFLNRQNAKSARIYLTSGRMVIRSSRSLPRVVTTRALRGAVVSRFDTGADERFVLTLAEKHSLRSPISIELTTERAAKDIRKALGIRRDGFGEVDWSLTPTLLDQHDGYARIAAFVSCLLLVVAPSIFRWSTLGALFGIGMAAIIFSSLVSAARLGRRAPAIILTPTRFELRHRGIVERLRYDEIRSVSDAGTTFTLEPATDRMLSDGGSVACRPARWARSGMRADERAIMLAHLRGAIVQANASSPTTDDDAFQIDQLQRGQSSVIDWLARIDALAATQSEPGYRGSSITEEDLWRAVESHETAADVRAAAARLLIRISPENSHDRVASVLTSIHDDAERAHVRAALDTDLDAAAREIEAIDLDERRS